MAAAAKEKPAEAKNYYRGFVAGIFSGVAKLAGEQIPKDENRNTFQ